MESKTSVHLPTKTTIGLLLLIAGCVLSSFRILQGARLPNLSARDGVERLSDGRFAALKSSLPAVATIGYIEESTDPAIPYYYLTQYALAPVVVEHSINHKLVVGNFPTLQHPPVPPGLRLLKDFGNGVLLFTNEGAN
ncbi:MAG: hypothetical protein WA477_03845 [Candidatus Sulfotelmatobacter sp.]